jgi:protocatechuate 3,4-dioxygenase beta subunit
MPQKLPVFLAVALSLGGDALSAPAARAGEGSLSLVGTDEPGTRLTLTGTVVDGNGRPLPGAELRVYQTDVSGRYTRERAMDEQHARLAGRLRTDAKGRFELRTIRPGGYPNPLRLGGRERKIPAHIHIDVTAVGHALRKLQVVFADDPLLGDPYWQDWAKRFRHPVLEVRAAGAGGAATLRIVLEPAPHQE